MKNVYQPVSATELKQVIGPRPGARALNDVIVPRLFSKGVRSAGIYNRRPRRGLTALNPRTASLHAAGRAVDISIPNQKVGDELFLRLISAADAIGICEIIWWDRRVSSDGVKAYKGKDNHHTHIHIGLTSDFADRTNTPDLRKWISHFIFG